MKYIKLNKNWNAAPTATEPQIIESENFVELIFELDPAFAHVDEGEKGTLEFCELFAYKLTRIDQEAYLKGAFRFQNDQLPWGEFYELKDSHWKTDFPSDKVIVNESLKDLKLNHYLFFLPGCIFECLALDYNFHFDTTVPDRLEEIYPKGYFNHYLTMFSAHFNQLNTDNFKVYTNLYIQLEGKKEFEGLKEELKKIKANKDLDSYVKIANYHTLNFGRKQMDELVKVIETYDPKSKYA
ncbi:hypothetical protein [Fluviicola sp.]|uniref:hypothetical protein n=1 Tax=Fluviicola sp. TaxID=1917219 RepID=UPI0031D09D7D